VAKLGVRLTEVADFTNKEKQFLVENVKKMTTFEMADALKRTNREVVLMCRQMRLIKDVVYAVKGSENAWTDKEDKFITDNINELTHGKMGVALGRTDLDVRNRCRKLGLKKYQTFAKDPEHEKKMEFIKNNYKTMTHAEMAEATGLTKVKVSKICARKKYTKENPWDDEQDIKIKELIKQGKNWTEVHTYFPERTLYSIQQRCCKLKKEI